MKRPSDYAVIAATTALRAAVLRAKQAADGLGPDYSGRELLLRQARDCEEVLCWLESLLYPALYTSRE